MTTCARRLVRLAAALVVLLAVCASGARAMAAPIRLWHAYRGDEERALVAILSRYHGDGVETLAVPYDAFLRKLAAAIPLGEGPDLFIDQHDRLGDYRARDIIAPVGDALESDGAYAPAAIAAVRDGADAWGVPLSLK